MWIAALIIMALVMFVLLNSMVRSQNYPEQNNNFVEFYHGQIAEIELQLTQQLISEQDAEVAKAEAARALIKHQVEAKPHATGAKTIRITSIALLAIVPAITLSSYELIGSPQIADMPLVTRERPKQTNISQIEKFEDLLKKNPDNSYIYDNLLKQYMNAKRFEDAAQLLMDLNARLGSTPLREANLGEALMMANEGIISVESYAAFERALKIYPKFNKARYYIGKAAEQDGKIDKARGIWVDLTNDMPQGPLKTMVEGEIDRLDKKSAVKTKTP